MTPADELRTAADKLRALATAASTDTDGTPTAHWNAEPCWPNDPDSSYRLYGDYITRDDGSTDTWPLLLRGGSMQRPTSMHAQHALYAAAMGPGVGTALADWLDWAADGCERRAKAARLARHISPEPEGAAQAIAVARQILGTAP